MISSSVSELSTADAAFLEGLVRSVLDGARLLRVTPLKPDTSVDGGTLKGIGYGAPVRLDVAHAGRVRSLVLHTAVPNEFGHDRRADRAAEMLLAADTFPLLPNHVIALDVGAYRRGNGFVSLRGTGEFYLLTTWAEGHPYADDLRSLATRGRAVNEDYQQVESLVRYLGRLHAEVVPEEQAYMRSIRDLVGSGEGIFGIIDAYPEQTPGVSQERLARLEGLCVDWRQRLKHKSQRLRRTHGDFHPFNVLFDHAHELVLLDASRGCAGDPADDVTALSINYLFFGLENRAAWKDGFGPLWQRFWTRYQELTHDSELYDVIAPFFTWRALVLSCPRWYPDAQPDTRERLLSLAERLLEGERFRPELGDELVSG